MGQKWAQCVNLRAFTTYFPQGPRGPFTSREPFVYARAFTFADTNKSARPDLAQRGASSLFFSRDRKSIVKFDPPVSAKAKDTSTSGVPGKRRTPSGRTKKNSACSRKATTQIRAPVPRRLFRGIGSRLPTRPCRLGAGHKKTGAACSALVENEAPYNPHPHLGAFLERRTISGFYSEFDGLPSASRDAIRKSTS